MSFLSDLNFIFEWWLLFFVIGVIFLPLTFQLFKKFIDKGYLFSRVLGICLISYFVFIGSTFHIFKYSVISIVLAIVGFLILNIYIFIKNKSEFILFIKNRLSLLIFEESIFFIILVAWSFVRGLAPNIEGLEKFMDWGFINSILRTDYMPPADMWYAGSSINYYYFGQLFFATLTKISGIASAITYNLSIASLCALTFSLSFSLIVNIIHLKFTKFSLKKIIIYSLIGSWFLTFSGNFHPFYKIFSKASSGYQISKNFSKYWYPDATRFIGHDPETSDKTIHEFPLYSFIVSDLHGHVNDIPIVLLFLAISFSFLLSKKQFFNPQYILLASLILSWCYTTNAWDFAVYGLFFGILSLFSTKNVVKTIITGLLIIVFWFVWTLPFSRNFQPMAQGLVISNTSSPFYQLFILYGGFWIVTLPVVFIKKKFDHSTIFIISLLILATLLIFIPEIIFIKDIYTDDYRRANTMFKLVYQAFILYSICIPFCFLSVISAIKNVFLKLIYIFIFVFVFIAHSSYLYFSLSGYYFYKSKPIYRGLYGMNFMKESLPNSFETVNWINQNIAGQPVILEASGDSYSTFNHVSMATGLPTPIGWLVHEWLWRNGYDGPAQRQEDVKQLYTTKDLTQFSALVSKYKIKYIIVGQKEQEKYITINIDNLTKSNAKVVFESGDTKIYQLPF